MDNPVDPFAPLTEAELADAARQVPRDLEADAPKPTCPPLDVESGALAAARLFGRKPGVSWRYETAEGETAFYIARWDEGADKKTFRPVSWREGSRMAADGMAKQSAALQLAVPRRAIKLGNSCL